MSSRVARVHYLSFVRASHVTLLYFFGQGELTFLFFLLYPPRKRSLDEVNTLKERIKDWAAAHDHLEDYNNNKFEFLFKVGLPDLTWPSVFIFILCTNPRGCSTRAEASKTRRTRSEAC